MRSFKLGASVNWLNGGTPNPVLGVQVPPPLLIGSESWE